MSRLTSHGRVRVGVAALVVAAVVAANVSSAAARTAPAHTFEIRPVVAISGGNAVSLDACEGLPGAGRCVKRSAPTGTAYLLGPAGVTGDDVRRSVAATRPGMGPLVEITLTSAGRRRFSSMAAAAFPAQPPQNQLGIVVDGTVKAAPAVMAPRIDGSIQVSGDFTASNARAIARAINASR